MGDRLESSPCGCRVAAGVVPGRKAPPVLAVPLSAGPRCIALRPVTASRCVSFWWSPEPLCLP